VRKLIYSMGVSLDGFIAGPDGSFHWAAPDEELHRFHNQQARETGVELYGRQLYEIMLFWDAIDEGSDAGETSLEFARIWRETPKIVFSTTLAEVRGANTRLATRDVLEEVAALKAQPGADLAVGGAGLAATCIAADLVDEYRLFVNPVIVGSGTPFFPRLERPIDLELVERRTFGSRVVYLRYRRQS
jgi:dihydrofolate reductase